MRARRVWIAVTIVIATGGLASCGGIKDPYQAATRTTPRPTRASATTTATPADGSDPAPERGGTIPKRLRSAQGQIASGAARPNPRATLARYALHYVNWDATHVIATERQLASISLGQARAQASQAAASAARDPQLTRSHVQNTGQVVAISQGEGAAGGEWVIVTRELTTGQGDYSGLPPTLHVIYAQVTNSPHGWIVSRWQPQN